MSDTHKRHKRLALPDADLFVHAGDFTNFGDGAEEFAIWYWQLPYKQKLLVLGNHETVHATQPRSLETWRKLFGPTLLDNETREVRAGDERLIVYGAPYGCKNFSAPPSGISLAITHEPPYGILDTASGGHIGEREIGDFIERTRPDTHVFGHAHASGGRREQLGATLYVNAATRSVLIEAGGR